MARKPKTSEIKAGATVSVTSATLDDPIDKDTKFRALDYATRAVGKMTNTDDAKVATGIADHFLEWIGEK